MASPMNSYGHPTFESPFTALFGNNQTKRTETASKDNFRKPGHNLAFHVASHTTSNASDCFLKEQHIGEHREYQLVRASST